MPVTILSYLFQHTILFLVIFWVAVGYIYRGPIFGISAVVTAPEEVQVKKYQPLEATTEISKAKPLVAEDNNKILVRSAVKQSTLSAEEKDFSFRSKMNKGTRNKQANVATEENMLQAARKAYWTGNRSLSLNLYVEAANEFPESLDILGEAGNIFYENDDTVRAVEYWSKLLPLLDKKGLKDKARSLERLIVNLSPDKKGTK